MSVRALTWSFNLPLQDMAAKAVLHALSDHADEEGRCWPSIARIARWAGCNDKTARKAMQRLADLGLVAREPRAGTSDLFSLNFDWVANPSLKQPLPKQGGPKSAPAPLPKVEGHPSLKRPPTPPKTGSRTTIEPSINPQENRQATARGSRITEDFKPDEVSKGVAINLGLDPEEVRVEVIDYWIAVPGKTGCKLDWNATYRNRCRQLAKRPAYQPRKSFAEQASDRANTVASVDEVQWRSRFKGRWMTEVYGPAPGEPGCRVPPHLIAEWRAQQ